MQSLNIKLKYQQKLGLSLAFKCIVINFKISLSDKKQSSFESSFFEFTIIGTWQQKLSINTTSKWYQSTVNSKFLNTMLRIFFFFQPTDRIHCLQFVVRNHTHMSRHMSDWKKTCGRFETPWVSVFYKIKQLKNLWR